MLHRERAFAALSGRIPDHVPTFELEFQLAEEFFGKPLLPEALRPENLPKLSAAEKDRLPREMAKYAVRICDRPDCSILPLHSAGDFGCLKYRSGLPEKLDPRQIHARHSCGRAAVQRLLLQLRPLPLAQDVQPVHRTLPAPHHPRARKNGRFAIKHTDGHIMPILGQPVGCEPNAQQTGAGQDAIDSAGYCLTYGKPGGCIFRTGNAPFKGMPPERCRLILDLWMRMRGCD